MPIKKAKPPLSKTHPKLAKEADGWDPSLVSSGTHPKRSWKCSLGHKWIASPNSRTHLNNPTGCPYCSGKLAWPGFNDLQTTNPEVSILADGWDPSVERPGSGVKRSWKCKLGHTWIATIHDQIKSEGRCAYCNGQKAWPGFNDLATTNPELARELVDADPSQIRSGSNKKFSWQCKKGHRWTTSPNERSRGKGCPFCSGKFLLVGFNDLSTTHPQISSELVGLNPTTISKGSNLKVEWRCSYDHKWISTANQRTGGYGCPFCSGKSVWPGFNDLLTTHPKLAQELLNLNPSTITQGSVKKVWWKCANGHKWLATPNNRTASDSGCPTCFIPGFDPNKDGFLYFIEQVNWEMLQVGISNIPKDRLHQHNKSGWELIEIRGPMDGHLTQQWETAILRMLKAKGADLSNSKIAGKFDGYSEAWSKSTFPVKSIKELIRLTEEFEENK